MDQHKQHDIMLHYYNKLQHTLVQQKHTIFYLSSQLINHITKRRGLRLSALKLTYTRNNVNVLIWLQDGNIRFCLYGPKRCISRLIRVKSREREPALYCRHRYFKLYIFFSFRHVFVFCFFRVRSSGGSPLNACIS